MDLRPLRTETDYDWALRKIERCFVDEAELGSSEADRFGMLASPIEAYETKYWAIDLPDPINAIRVTESSA